MHYGGFMNIVVYGSQYGTAKRYAEELAYRVGYELIKTGKRREK